MGALGEALGVPRAALGAPWGDLGLLGGTWGSWGGRAGLIYLLQTSQVKLLSYFTTLVPLGRPPTGTQMMRKADEFSCFPGDIFFILKSIVFCCKVYNFECCFYDFGPIAINVIIPYV